MLCVEDRGKVLGAKRIREDIKSMIRADGSREKIN